MFKGIRLLYLVLIPALILAACQAPPTSPEPVVETLVVTEVVEATPVEVIQVATPTPEPEGPRTLVICMGTEPEGLSPYGGGGLDDQAILFALYEDGGVGAIDGNSFTSQPIIHEKLPSLADGDVNLVAVSVNEGDTVVDANGELVVLDASAEPPIRLIPAGGGDPVTYQGGEFKMDQVSVTFKILPGLVWSDGTPITASDSVYAFNLISDPDNGLEYFPLGRTASYVSIDDLSTVWTGLPGYLHFDYHFFGPAPEHLWGQYSIEELFELDEYTRAPVGWGPYIVDAWVQGQSLTLRKNPNYFRADEGLPRFDTLIYRFVGQSGNVNIAALLSGECDILDESTGLEDQSELLLDLQAADQIRASFTTNVAWEHIDFGIQPRAYDDGYQLGVDRSDFFSDVRTRQAFAYCMDRQALVNDILFGQSIVLDSYVPPQHPLYNPNIRRYGYDLIAGRTLLEEVGWVDEDGDPATPRVAQGVVNVPDGTQLEVSYETTSSPMRQQVTAIIKESLAQCGIKTNIQLSAPSEWFADAPEGKLFGRKFDLGQFAWGVAWCGYYLSGLIIGPVGESWISILDGETRTFNAGAERLNVSGFANNGFDSTCHKILGYLPGQSRYEEAYLESQEIFAEQIPSVPLFPRIRVTATRPDLCGFIVDPTGGAYWNLEEFEYGEGCEE
jgi:peptide/nickel transport system substrate-binding protein